MHIGDIGQLKAIDPAGTFSAGGRNKHYGSSTKFSLLEVFVHIKGNEWAEKFTEIGVLRQNLLGSLRLSHVQQRIVSQRGVQGTNQ